MSFSIDSYGKVAKPRVYVDYVQYAKAIGMVKFYYGRDFYNVNGTYEDAWDFNPAKTSTYQVISSNGYPRLGVVFKNSAVEIPEDGDEPYFTYSSAINMQFRLLLDTINYYGLLNHNLGTFYTSNAQQRQCSLGTTTGHNSRSEIVGHLYSSYINDIGYSLSEHNNFKGGDAAANYTATSNPEYFEGLYIQLKNCINDSNAYGNEEPLLDLGTITAGRYFDFPQNADLNVSQAFDYSGIKSNKTISGDEMTQIDYYQSPNWGDFAPWTNIDLQSYQDMGLDIAYAVDYEDNKATRRTGRRSFTVTFSYIDKTDMFPKNFYKNLSGDYEPITEGSNSGIFTFDEDESIVSSFLNYTLGGQIPFIFQPDNTKKDFVICRLSKSNSTIKQVAPGVYSVTFSFVETW